MYWLYRYRFFRNKYITKWKVKAFKLETFKYWKSFYCLRNSPVVQTVKKNYSYYNNKINNFTNNIRQLHANLTVLSSAKLYENVVDTKIMFYFNKHTLLTYNLFLDKSTEIACFLICWRFVHSSSNENQWIIASFFDLPKILKQLLHIFDKQSVQAGIPQLFYHICHIINIILSVYLIWLLIFNWTYQDNCETLFINKNSYCAICNIEYIFVIHHNIEPFS